MTVPSTERVEEIRARLAAASTGTTLNVHEGGSTLRASVSGGDRGRFVNSMGDLVAATVGGTGPLTVTTADDEDGQDATLALHARDDIEFLLGLVGDLQGQLDKARALHQPERRYTPDDGETSYATYSEAADASFDGVGTPRSVTFFEVCSHCASIEMAEGCEHDYKESLWPCADAVALGLGEGDGQ